MTVRWVTLAERPDLAEAMWATGGTTSWPEFMLHDPLAPLYYRRVESDFAEWVVLLLDGGSDGRDRSSDEALVAVGFSVPYPWDRDVRSLPARGWDAVVASSAELGGSRRAVDGITTASALEIAIPPRLRGRAYSTKALQALRANAARLGCEVLLAPVRPNEKHLEPRMPIGDYVRRRRVDGLSTDAWLRTHERAGGRIVKVAPCSMTISGSLQEWRDWTALPMDSDGPVEVPGALVPVQVDLAQDSAVYVEPNVWMIHGV